MKCEMYNLFRKLIKMTENRMFSLNKMSINGSQVYLFSLYKDLKTESQA